MTWAYGSLCAMTEMASPWLRSLLPSSMPVKPYLTPLERDDLTRLASVTDRTKSSVLRLVLVAAERAATADPVGTAEEFARVLAQGEGKNEPLSDDTEARHPIEVSLRSTLSAALGGTSTGRLVSVCFRWWTAKYTHAEQLAQLGGTHPHTNPAVEVMLAS